jgi:hypothetical protein
LVCSVQVLARVAFPFPGVPVKSLFVCLVVCVGLFSVGAGPSGFSLSWSSRQVLVCLSHCLCGSVQCRCWPEWLFPFLEFPSSPCLSVSLSVWVCSVQVLARVAFPFPGVPVKSLFVCFVVCMCGSVQCRCWPEWLFPFLECPSSLCFVCVSPFPPGSFVTIVCPPLMLPCVLLSCVSSPAYYEPAVCVCVCVCVPLLVHV